MMTDVVIAFIATMALVATFVVARDTGRCPDGYWLSTGVRPDGRYTCTRVPVGDDHRDARGIVRDDSIVPPGETSGQFICTGGAQAIVVDFRTVGCQRGLR